jgi:hypothetical protein
MSTQTNNSKKTDFAVNVLACLMAVAAVALVVFLTTHILHVLTFLAYVAVALIGASVLSNFKFMQRLGAKNWFNNGITRLAILAVCILLVLWRGEAGLFAVFELLFLTILITPSKKK